MGTPARLNLLNAFQMHGERNARKFTAMGKSQASADKHMGIRRAREW